MHFQQVMYPKYPNEKDDIKLRLSRRREFVESLE